MSRGDEDPKLKANDEDAPIEDEELQPISKKGKKPANNSLEIEKGSHKKSRRKKSKLLTPNMRRLIEGFLVIIWLLLTFVILFSFNNLIKVCPHDLLKCMDLLRFSFGNIVYPNVMISLCHFAIFCTAFCCKFKFTRVFGYIVWGFNFVMINYGKNGFMADFDLAIRTIFNYLFGVWISLFIVWYCINKIMKWNLKIGIMSLVIFLLYASYFLYSRLFNSCSKYYTASLDPSVLQNDSYTSCKFQKPSICYHYLIDGIYKPLYWFTTMNSCSYGRNIEEASIYRRIAKSNKIVATPRLSDYDYDTMYFSDLLYDALPKMSKPTTPSELANSTYEVFFDFRNDPLGKVIIKLRDITKTPEYKNEFKDHDKDHPNVLHVFIDTVSRHRILRKFPQTVEWFRKYLPNKKAGKTSYEFVKMHAIKGYTAPNLEASFYGTTRVGTHSKRASTEFRESGYVTGDAYNYCATNPFTYSKSNFNTNLSFSHKGCYSI